MEQLSLQAIRANLRMSQAEFAKAIKMPLSTYQRREAEPYNLTLEEAKRIADYSGISLTDIKIDKD